MDVRIRSLRSRHKKVVQRILQRKSIKMSFEKNAAENIRGDVMLKNYHYKNHKGYMPVSTRYHFSSNAFNADQLHPTRLGPVYHPHPHLPPASSLHNYWYGNMVCECDEDQFGVVKQSFYDRQMYVYTSTVTQSTPVNPIWWMWVTPDGLIKKYSIHHARQFFCMYYERLVRGSSQFAKLKTLLKNGLNLRICGDNICYKYKSIDDNYLYGQFGCDMMLYSILALPQEELPWHKYKTEQF